MAVITRKLEFDAAHRVLGHESKCAHLHGHRYVAEISITAADLDDIGRVLDFSVVKRLVGGWIDEYWDHNIILSDRDPLAVLWRSGQSSVFGDRAPYIMPNDMNTTVECLVQELYRACVSLLKSYPVRVVHIRIYETPNSWADYSG